MTEHINLLGAEDVKRAGYEMSAAAESVRQSSGFFGEYVAQMSQVLDEHATRIEAANAPSADTSSEVCDQAQADANWLRDLAEGPPVTEGCEESIADRLCRIADTIAPQRACEIQGCGGSCTSRPCPDRTD